MTLRRFVRRLRWDAGIWGRLVVVAGLLVGAAAGLAWGTYVEIWPAVVSHGYFRLRTIRVISDGALPEPARLAARAGLYDGTSLWQVDAERVRSVLTSAPWVRDVRIHRRFPNEVALEVDKREPVAATVTALGLYLVDADGVVYREEGTPPTADLPYVTGWDTASSHAERVARLRYALALIRAVEVRGIVVSQVDVGGDLVRLYPDRLPVPVLVRGDDEPARVASRLAAVWRSLPADTSAVREIDLRYRDRAVVRATRATVAALANAFATSTGQGDAIVEGGRG